MRDIKKDVVALMLERASFEVIDLGVETTADGFLKVAEEHKPDMVAVAALLTTTMMMRMSGGMNVFAEAALRDDVKKMIIGGAPVTLNYAEEKGADGLLQTQPVRQSW